jgi:hypothetical protein
MGGQADDPGRGTAWGVEFHARVPRAAEDHPIWRLADDPVQNRRLLERMPPFLGTNLIRRLKPAATALAYSDRPLQRVGVMPVFACEPYGAGRTFAMAPDTTDDWGARFEREWGENGDNRYFRKFWRNVVLWLGENSGGDRRLRVETDRIIYRPGQPIRLTVRALDEKRTQTTEYRVVARLRAPADKPGAPGPLLQEAPLAPRADDEKYAGQLTAPPTARVTTSATNPLLPFRPAVVEVVAFDRDRQAAQTSLEVQVADDPVEFIDPRPDRARLESLAAASGGRVLHDGRELAELLRGMGSAPGEVVVRKAPLWDNPAVWGLLLALLTADWCLRRWWGLG